MTDTGIAICWTLLILAGFFFFLGIFVAHGYLEKLELLGAIVILDCIAFGMFFQQLLGRKK
jgi:hypothetical protein